MARGGVGMSTPAQSRTKLPKSDIQERQGRNNLKTAWRGDGVASLLGI